MGDQFGHSDADLERGDMELMRRQEDAAILELRDRAIKAKSPSADMTEMSPEDVISALRDIVDEQASDARLWFQAEHITEATLQSELRRIHAAIEGISPDDCARVALRGDE